MTEYLSGEAHRALQQVKRQPQGKPNMAIRLLIAVVIVLVAAGSFLAWDLAKGNNNANSNMGYGAGGNGAGGTSGLNGTPPAGGPGPQNCMGSSCGSGAQSHSGFSSQPIAGKVTAVSATSITIQPTSGAAQTFSIASSTQELRVDPAAGTNNASPQAYNSNDVHVGDSIGIVPSSSDSSQAQTILLDYQMQENARNS